MANQLVGRKVAILASSGVEEVELIEPRDAVRKAGAQTEVLSIEPGEIQAMNQDVEKASRIRVDRQVSDASVDDYDALLLPGGTTNPDHLRQNPDAVGFVRDFFATGKPVGVICHGPWTMVEADVVRGRTLTSWPSMRTDIRNAGGNVVDQEVVIDKNLVSSRGPQDIPAFCSTIVEEFAKSKHAVRPGPTAR